MIQVINTVYYCFWRHFMIHGSFNSRFNLTFLVTLSLTIFSSSFRRRSFVGSFRWSIWSPNKKSRELYRKWISQIVIPTNSNCFYYEKERKNRVQFVIFDRKLAPAVLLIRLFLSSPCSSTISQFTRSDWKHFPFSNWNIFLSLIGISSFF